MTCLTFSPDISAITLPVTASVTTVPLRNFQNNVTAVSSVAAALAARSPVLRLELSAVAVIGQSIQALVHFKDHISAFSAVASVRTAVGHVEFSSETHNGRPRLFRTG